MTYRYYGPADHKLTVREVLWPDGQRPAKIAIDTETVSLKDRTPVGVGIAASDREAVYFPLPPDATGNPDLPWELVNDSEIIRIYHNHSFDFDVLKDWEPNPYNIADTLVMAHLLCLPGEMHELTWFVDPHWRHNETVRSMRDVMAEHGAKATVDLPDGVTARKCCIDCMCTYHMYEGMVGKVNPAYFDLEMSLVPVLVRMSRRGVKVDPVMRDIIREDLESVLVNMKSVSEDMGFNPGSPQQVGYLLAKRGNWLPFGPGHRSLVTNKKVLEKIADPMAGFTLQYRHYKHTLGHYVLPLEGCDRAYTRFHLDAATGRISSTETNLINWPQFIRAMLLPDSGIFTDADASQIEMRILAALSGDEEMAYIFENNLSIHEQTAEAMNCPYKIAKNTGFAMIYGATEETMMDTARTNDRGLARRFMEAWGRKYRQAWAWIQETQQDGIRTGKGRTLLGREFVYPIEEGDAAVARKAVNYPIQGTAAEWFKRALLIMSEEDLVLPVHDEILFDGEVKIPEVLEYLLPGVRTPVSVKRTERWE